jgi:hypothetical protein
MNEPGNHDAKCKKADIKHYMWYGSIYMRCPGQANSKRKKVD